MLPTKYVYPAVFTYEKNQEIAVVFPDLDVATSGIDEEDALESARELLGCVMYGLEEDGEEIPEPTSLFFVDLEENEKVMLIDVFMPAFRLSNTNKSVNRTVTLPAWLNAAALEQGINFSQALQATLMNELEIKHK